MSDWDVARLRAGLFERRSSTIAPLADMRAQMDAAKAVFPLPDLSVECHTIGYAHAEWLAPPGCEDCAAILYLHGGGFVAGSPDSHRHLAGAIAEATQLPALLLDYRLAPEHPHPTALEDCEQAFNWLVERTILPSNIAVVGDSAGGGLALALSQKLRAAGEPRPACLALMSPWLDLQLQPDEHRPEEKRDPAVSFALLSRLADLYQDSEGLGPSRFAPLDQGLQDLPPILVQVGSEEILLSDSVRLQHGVEATGGDIQVEIGEGLFHVWQGYVPRLPEAREAVLRLSHFVAGHCRG